MQKTAEQRAEKKRTSEDPHALVVPDGTEVICEEQFKEGEYESILIPKSVVAVQKGAFANWKHLQKVAFEEGS